MTAAGARPSSTAVAVVFAMVLPSVLTWYYFVHLADQAEAGQDVRVQQAAYVLGKVVQFSFPILFLLWSAPGELRPGRPHFGGLALGLGFGLLVAAGMLGLYFSWLRNTALFEHTPTQLRDKLAKFHADAPGVYLGLAVFVALPHSLCEEYYWRWFVFGRLRKMIPLRAAVAVSSLAFMAHHVILLNHYFPGRFLEATLPFSLGVAVGGAVWAWLYDRTGSIYSPWLSHLIIDATLFVLGWDLLRRASG